MQIWEGQNTKKGEFSVSSNSGHRQQKIPQGSSRQWEAVNTLCAAEAPSSQMAQTHKQTCEEENCLMERVVSRQNMLSALKRVQQNKGSAGEDGMTVKELPQYLKEHWLEIRQSLLNGSYKPKPIRRVEIPKPDGGIRQLGIPVVLDRLIQQAILQLLTPIFDPQFSESSYGFRPKRNAHQAVKKAKEYIQAGDIYVVDIDIEKFFDRVNHDILMSMVARKARDKRVLRLIGKYLRSGVMVNGVCHAAEEGTPQGGNLSPLLANILLDELDKELEKRGHKFVRYADDCNIYVASRRSGLRVMSSVKAFVERKLKLKINERKSAVDYSNKRKFLGFSFTSGSETKIRLAKQIVVRAINKIKALTNRSKGWSIEKRIKELNQYLRGWLGYFRIAETPSVFQRMDEWLRRRLRMCLLKQWKLPRTKTKRLTALGLDSKWAGRISNSRKGIWHLACTPQMHKALNLAYWQEIGLVSLAKTHYTLCQSL